MYFCIKERPVQQLSLKPLEEVVKFINSTFKKKKLKFQGKNSSWMDFA